MPLIFKALWKYRQFILSSIIREFQSRYRASLLGGAWAIAQPLTLILIYTLIFGHVMRAGLVGHGDIPFAFSIYLCAGVIHWSLFAEVLSKLTTVFVDQGVLIKKSNFPRVCLPAIVIGSSLLNYLIIFVLYLVFLALIDHLPGVPILAVFMLLSVQVAFATGLGVLLGSLNVFFRDIAQLVGVLLQFWFWLTPIVYTLDVIPNSVKEWFFLNPMLPVIDGYQRIFLGQTWPSIHQLLPAAGVALLALIVGFFFFMRCAPEMVDEI